MNLVGPVAGIKLTGSRGCEPRTVFFANTSKFYTDFYMDYGDSSKLDTNTLWAHTYQNNLDQTSQFYSPKIIVVDAGGCIAEKTLYNEVRVHNYSIIKASFIPDTIVCQRESIVISDTGLYSSRYRWSINDSSFSTQKKDTVEILNSGTNSIRLISKNGAGCADTLVQSIYTKPSAVFDFEVPEFVCQNQPTSISLDITNSGDVQSYQWDLGEPQNTNNIQNTIAPRATISYLTPGKKKVIVTPLSNNGCDIQDSITLNVFDPDKIPTIQLRYAGYDSLNNIILDYPKFNFNYFDKFNIYRNNSFLRQDSLSKARLLVDRTSTFDQQNCYNLSLTEKCGVEGERGRVHCPVQMTVSGTDDRKIQLEWTYYVGWNRVDRYEIYRREADSAFKKVGEVFNTQKSYTDSGNVCDVLYYYKVAAVQSQTELISYSNTESAKTTINLNEELAHLDNVSILSENAIELRWQPIKFRYNDHYQITRYSGRLNNLDATLITDTSYFIDSFPLQDNPYIYLLQEVDNCDERSKSGNI